MRAYDDAISTTSTEHAPWFVIPSDKKWYRNFAISSIIRETMEALDPQYPKSDVDPRTFVIE
jgi:polyphosphate kinase 2 (PPK2 family)